jgi:hypothetical protein
MRFWLRRCTRRAKGYALLSVLAYCLVHYKLALDGGGGAAAGGALAAAVQARAEAARAGGTVRTVEYGAHGVLRPHDYAIQADPAAARPVKLGATEGRIQQLLRSMAITCSEADAGTPKRDADGHWSRLVSGSKITFLDKTMRRVGACHMTERGEPTCEGHEAAAYVHKCVPLGQVKQVQSRFDADWIQPAFRSSCPGWDGPVNGSLAREQWALRQLESYDIAPRLVSPYEPDETKLAVAGIVMTYTGRPLSKDAVPADAEQQALRIAGALHRAGVSHNDAKNTELMLDAGGKLRLVDFGYATAGRREFKLLHFRGCVHHLQLMLDDQSALLSALGDVQHGLESVALTAEMWKKADEWSDPLPGSVMVRRRPSELHVAVVFPPDAPRGPGANVTGVHTLVHAISAQCAAPAGAHALGRVLATSRPPVLALLVVLP